MSDIGLPAADEVVDTELLDLLAKLRPILEATAKAAVTEAVAAVPVPVKRPGSVQGVDPVARTASVLVDGDTTAIVAQCIVELPGLADRVMVEFNPSGAVFVVGNQSVAGLPAGTLAPYAGPITAHAGAVATAETTGQPPRGWLWCAGQAVSRATYSALFRAISTTYGVGDGSQTFNVPDLRGRLPVGMDNMGGSDAGRIAAANTLGTTGGQATVVAHDHGLNSHNHSTPNHSHGAGSLAVSSHSHSFSATTGTDGSHTHSVDNTVSYAGYGQNSPINGNATEVATRDTSSNGSHSHSVSGTSGSTAPSVSGSTANEGSGTSGNASGNTASTGSGTEQLPPFVIVHWLIRT